MENFINEEYIKDLLNKTSNVSNEDIDKVLDKASLMKGLNHQEVAILLNIKDEKQVERLHEISRNLKKAYYGDRVVLFAPLYLSDYCVNNCVYCGYRRDNKFERSKLSIAEVTKQVKALESIGHKRLALEYGEDPLNITMDYVLETIKAIYDAGDIRRVNVNLAATTLENYQKLATADIGTYILFQETYHQPTYIQQHPDSLKGDYLRQLTAHHIAGQAGLDDVGGGVLFGLYDYRFEMIALMLHNEKLLEDFGYEFHTISVPRLKKANGVDLNNYPYMIDDETFIKLVSIIRISCPSVGIILSTRENKQMRELLINQGVSQISANSKTTVGGYTNEEASSQFSVDDERSLLETMKDLIHNDHLPSYCTACYRNNRTGKEFHDQVGSLKIAAMCHPNAILTTLEFALDSKDQKLLEETIPLLEKQLELIKDESIQQKTKEFYQRILNGERDLYI